MIYLGFFLEYFSFNPNDKRSPAEVVYIQKKQNHQKKKKKKKKKMKHVLCYPFVEGKLYIDNMVNYKASKI